MLRERVFLGGQAVSMLGDGLAVLAIPLLVLQLTRNPLAAVLASLPGSVGYLAAGLPAGVLADRVSPWLVLIAGDVIRALIFLALFVLTGSHAIAPSLILSLAFAAGAVTVFADTALAIAVRDVFTGPRLISANSWLESANQGGLIIGPSAAGLLAAAGLLHEAMLIDALTFLVSLASLAGVRRRYRPAGTTGRKAVTWRTLRHELAEGIRYLAATRLLLTLLVFLLTLNLCLGADKLVIFLGQDTLHLPPGQVGFLVTAGGIGGLAGAAGTGLLCRWLTPLPVVTLCCAGSGMALVLISAATAMPVLLIGNLLYTWAIVAASVTMRSLRQVLVRRELLGRVTASWRLGGQTVTFVGGVLAGVMAGLLGNNPRPVIAAAGCLTLLTVAVAWFTGLQKENASGVAARLLGKQGPGWLRYWQEEVMVIRAVVFDIGGVLEITPDLGVIPMWEDRLGLSAGELSERMHDAFAGGSIGTISEDDVHQALRDRLGLDEQQVAAFMADIWREYLGTPNTELIEYARRLRPRYRTGILSNSFVGAREKEQAAYCFEDLVDDIVYSHEAGMSKPDPRIYALACARLGVLPDEAVFVDDTDYCVAGASQAGMHSIRYLDNAQVIHEIEVLLTSS